MAQEELNFEEQMAKLKELSEKISSKDVTLEEAIRCYEEGMRYHKKLTAILNEARQKIEYYGEEQS